MRQQVAPKRVSISRKRRSLLTGDSAIPTGLMGQLNSGDEVLSPQELTIHTYMHYIFSLPALVASPGQRST